MSTQVDVSVVIPVLDEEDCLDLLHRELTRVLKTQTLRVVQA